MRFEYEQCNQSLFLRCDIEYEDLVDYLSYGMMSNNCVPELIDVSYSQVDGRGSYYYNLMGKISLEQWMAQGLKKEKLCEILKHLCEIDQCLEAYMLKGQFVLWDPNYIYVDILTGKLSAICVALLTEHKKEIQLQEMVISVLKLARKYYSDDVDIITPMIEYVNNERLGREGFLAYLSELSFLGKGPFLEPIEKKEPQEIKKVGLEGKKKEKRVRKTEKRKIKIIRDKKKKETQKLDIQIPNVQTPRIIERHHSFGETSVLCG